MKKLIHSVLIGLAVILTARFIMGGSEGLGMFWIFLLSPIILIAIIFAVIVIVKKIGLGPIIFIGLLCFVVFGVYSCATKRTEETPRITRSAQPPATQPSERRYPSFKEGDSVFVWDGKESPLVIYITGGDPLMTIKGNRYQWVKIPPSDFWVSRYGIERIYADGIAIPVEGRHYRGIPTLRFAVPSGTANVTIRKNSE